MDLIYSTLVPVNEREAFLAKVQSVASTLQIDPNWLMQVMKAESGIRADIENRAFPFKDGYATGLIQFTPSTARGLNTTTTELKSMTRVKQLDYVLKYFLPYKGKIKSYFDLYLITFFPAAIPYSDQPDWVFEAKNISRASIAKSNPVIDRNKDGKITIAEFREYLVSTVSKELQPKVFAAAAGGLGLLIFIGVSIFILTR